MRKTVADIPKVKHPVFVTSEEGEKYISLENLGLLDDRYRHVEDATSDLQIGGVRKIGCLSMFPSLYVPRSLCSPVLCSPVSMLPGLMFPGIYVPQCLCFPFSMFHRPLFLSIYVPQYLCSPAPMFPSTYAPQYLCSPVPKFPISHNKRLRDAESVISAIFTLSSVCMSVHPFKVFTITW